MSLTILRMRYVLHTQTRTYHNGKEPLTTKVVGGNGWKNPAVMASLLWRTCLVCMLTSQSAQRKGRGRQSQHRTAAGFLPHCWQMCVATFSCAAAVFTRRGLSALHLSEKRLCRLIQFKEARRGSLGVSRGDASSPEDSLNECWRSCRKHSVNGMEYSKTIISFHIYIHKG